jgi:hypothetical protein
VHLFECVIIWPAGSNLQLHEATACVTSLLNIVVINVKISKSCEILAKGQVFLVKFNAFLYHFGNKKLIEA